MSTPIALSFSRLSDYEACPKKFESKYVNKTYPDDSSNPAFVKGNAIHKQLEDYVAFLRGEGPEPTMGQFTEHVVPLLKRLYKSGNGQMFPEKQLAVDYDWKECTWFSKPDVVKYRAIIDCLIFPNSEELLIIDWKSGKVRPYEDGPTTQLKLTAAMLFSLYPKLERITSSYIFVEHRETVMVKFVREQLDGLKEAFNDAHTVVNQDGEFAFKKNKYCNWCLIPKGQCPVRP